MVSKPMGFAMSAPASMNSWQRAMADSTALDAGGVGAGGDEQVWVAAGVERGL